MSTTATMEIADSEALPIDTFFELMTAPEIQKVLRCGKSAFYESVQRRLWTRAVHPLGGRASVWPADEVRALVRARIAGANDAAMRELVNQLEAARGEVPCGN